MVYVFDSKFDRYKANKIYKLIKGGAVAEQSATRIINQLKMKDLGYRRMNMLHDIRRARGVEFAKTANAYYAAELFFDHVYEPQRSQYDMRTSEANKMLKNWEKDLFETPEELEIIMEIDDRYMAIQELL